MSHETNGPDRTEPGALREIAAKYESMIEDVRERVHEINERMEPLAREVELPSSDNGEP